MTEDTRTEFAYDMESLQRLVARCQIVEQRARFAKDYDKAYVWSERKRWLRTEIERLAKEDELATEPNG